MGNKNEEKRNWVSPALEPTRKKLRENEISVGIESTKERNGRKEGRKKEGRLVGHGPINEKRREE